MPNGKPNILVIWGDDIGISNLSCYSDGLMGYRTPNIDRIANEGMRFTDSYGEQSCTAGRAAFISGQSVYRTGMSKVGIPGADDVMLNYQSTSFHDALYVRDVLGLRRAPEFEEWLESMQITDPRGALLNAPTRQPLLEGASEWMGIA